jgi:hypothetical protein
VCSACFPSGFAFVDLAADVGAGFVDVALLGDAGDVELAVHPPVAAEVEAMPGGHAGAFPGRQGDGAGAAPAGGLTVELAPSVVWTHLSSTSRSLFMFAPIAT